MYLTIGELLGYTDDERERWRRWFSERGGEPLKIELAGEAHPTVGALILHCFWAEFFYAYWMRGELLTEESEVVRRHKDVAADDAEGLFDFGLKARKEMRAFADSAGEEDWARVYEVEGGGFEIRGPARKLVAHILLHEVRHFAQVAAAVRERGLAPPGDHDILFSKSFGPLARRGGGAEKAAT